MFLKGKNVVIGLLCVGLLTACGEKEEKAELQSATEVTTTETKKQKSNKEKSTEETPKFFGLLEENLPYLGGTFDSDNVINMESFQTFNNSDLMAFDVIEKEGKVEIIWVNRDEDPFNVSVYRTVSNQEGWGKSQKLGTFKIKEDDGNVAKVIGRTLYLLNEGDNYGQEKTTTQIVFDESGNIQSQKEIKYMDYHVVGYTDKGRAISFDNTIYTAENPEQPLEIKDNYGLFDYDFYYNQENSKTFVKAMDLALVQLDAKTGEPLYNDEGQEASYGNPNVSGDYDRVIGGFGDYAIYAEFDSNTPSALISAISNEMLPAANFSIPIEGVSDLENFQTTTTDDEIHIWTIVEFQHKAVLKQFVLGKEIGQPMD